MLKAELAANICYIISICLAKLSLLSLILNLTPTRQHQYFLFTLSGYIILWSVISVFVAAFECRVPHTWDYTRGNCINRVGDQNRPRMYFLFTVYVGCLVDRVRCQQYPNRSRVNCDAHLYRTSSPMVIIKEDAILYTIHRSHLVSSLLLVRIDKK